MNETVRHIFDRAHVIFIRSYLYDHKRIFSYKHTHTQTHIDREKEITGAKHELDQLWHFSTEERLEA